MQIVLSLKRFYLYLVIFSVDLICALPLETMFTQRSQTDWERIWHHESHSKCRDNLIKHLHWACEKDIYRLSRRNTINDDSVITEKRFDIGFYFKLILIQTVFSIIVF